MKSQLYKINKTLKYCRFYNKIEQNLFGVTISRAISTCLCLHIQSLCLCYYCAGLACTLSLFFREMSTDFSSHVVHISCIHLLKDNKLVPGFKHNNIYFYLDHMFRSIDHHHHHNQTETCHRDKIIYCCVWLKPETILLSFSLVTQRDVLYKENCIHLTCILQPQQWNLFPKFTLVLDNIKI